MKNKIIILISVFLLFLIPFNSFALENTLSNEEVVANQDNNTSLIEGAKSGILMEEKTGTIIYEKNSNEKLAPASMTKIMTLLLTFEAIDQEILTFDQILCCSEYAKSMGGSEVYLEVGEKMTLDEALKCICIASAIDCAVMVAEAISGNISNFVNKMNTKALELGCNNTCFKDCTGLTDEGHYSSALDMALIARELVTKYPKVLEYTSIKEDYIRKDSSSPFWLVNTNKLASRVDGVDGLKTGYTSFSGYCITLHMTQNDMSLISVVFGYDSSVKRNSESLELLRYGFSNYMIYNPYNKTDTVYEENNILYENNKIIYRVPNDIILLIKKCDKNKYKTEVIEKKLKILYNDGIVVEEDIITYNSKKKNFLKLIINLALEILK